MIFCSNCGAKLEDTSKFCTVCGTAVAQSAPAPVVEPAPQPAPEPAPVAPAYTMPSEPVYTAPVEPTYAPPSAPTYSAPVTPVYATVEVPTNIKVQGIVGMALAIGGLALAAFGLLYVLIGMEEAGLGFGFSIGFGIFSWPLSIVGKILSGKSQEAGNTSATCSVGSKLGLVGIIVSAVMMFFGFINLMI